MEVGGSCCVVFINMGIVIVEVELFLYLWKDLERKVWYVLLFLSRVNRVLFSIIDLFREDYNLFFVNELVFVLIKYYWFCVSFDDSMIYIVLWYGFVNCIIFVVLWGDKNFMCYVYFFIYIKYRDKNKKWLFGIFGIFNIYFCCDIMFRNVLYLDILL